MILLHTDQPVLFRPRDGCEYASLDPDNRINIASELCMMRLHQVLSNYGHFPAMRCAPAESNVPGVVCRYLLSRQVTNESISRIKLKSSGNIEEGLNNNLVMRARSIIRDGILVVREARLIMYIQMQIRVGSLHLKPIRRLPVRRYFSPGCISLQSISQGFLKNHMCRRGRGFHIFTARAISIKVVVIIAEQRE